MMDTIRVKFLRGTSLGNGRDAQPGEVIDLDRRLYAAFAQQGRVVVVETPIAPTPAAAPTGEATATAPAPAPAPTSRKGKKNA